MAITEPVTIDEQATRLRLDMTGAVQGVGFRPFVHRLAMAERLGGFVRNTGDGVSIEVEGTGRALQRFLARLDTELPPHAVIFESGETRLMVQKLDAVTPPRGTALGWSVSDLRGTMTRLIDRGVRFERFEGMDQDELGVWSPAGPATGVAWFKDPDGNLLSLSLAEKS